MKSNILKNLLVSVLIVSCAVPTFAVAPSQIQNKTSAQLTAEILKNTQDITALQMQIDHARSVRTTTLWVAVPVTIIVAIVGVLTFGGGMMSDNPAAGNAAGSAGMGILAGAVAIGGGSAYLVHLKGKQIDQFRKALTALKKQNNDDLRILNSLK